MFSFFHTKWQERGEENKWLEHTYLKKLKHEIKMDAFENIINKFGFIMADSDA